jgi:pimeloyl-ACP methyl ester carboxylesterase
LGGADSDIAARPNRSDRAGGEPTVPEEATVVLIHGAWHGAWCWEKVTPLLDEARVAWVTIDLPLTSFEDDVAATRRAIADVGGPVVLCGHSYGGVVITEAGHEPNVQRLVYLAAFACDEGESPANTAQDEGVPAKDLSGLLVFTDDGSTVSLDETNAAASFFHDCSPEDVHAAVKQLRPMRFQCLATPVGAPAWRDKPSTYVVCTEDQAVHPELQRIMAKRCTDAVEWPSSHSPFLSCPDLVAELLVDLARA